MTDKGGLKRGKVDPKLVKKLLILESAAQVFSRNNFHAVKVQEIAEEAGVGKGTIYEYFSSKEELFIEMVREGFRVYRDRVFMNPEDDRELWVKLEAFIRKNAEFIWENQQIACFLIRSNHPFQDKLAGLMLDLRATLLENLVTTFRVAVERGEVKGITPEIAARMLWGAVSEVIAGMILFERVKPGDAVIQEVLTTFREGLGVE